MNDKLKVELEEIQGVLWIIAAILIENTTLSILFGIVGTAAIIHCMIMHHQIHKSGQ
jgi:hypothetical protein